MNGGLVRARSPRVAFQGEPGAYSELAILHRWGQRARALPAPTFHALLALVRDGAADYGVLPRWNSTIGDISAASAALDDFAHLLVEAGEIAIPVRHCLLALPGASCPDVSVVGTHPVALAQCARFFADRPRLRTRHAYDTAGAARELSQLRGVAADAAGERQRTRAWYERADAAAPLTLGVIASDRAAELYGLSVIARDVQDEPTNTTRFAVMAPRTRAAVR